jgi:hypothetical protein
MLESVQLLKVDSRFGTGEDGDPVRIITEYFKADGTLLLREDPHIEHAVTAAAQAWKEVWTTAPMDMKKAEKLQKNLFEVLENHK